MREREVEESREETAGHAMRLARHFSLRGAIPVRGFAKKRQGFHGCVAHDWSRRYAERGTTGCKYRSTEWTYEGVYLEIYHPVGATAVQVPKMGHEPPLEYNRHRGAVETEAWCIPLSHWHYSKHGGREPPTRVAWIGPISHQKEEPMRQIVSCFDGVI